MNQEASRNSHIIQLSYNNTESSIILSDPCHTIGRNSQNSIVISSKFVSRIHATLLKISDLGAQNTRYQIVDGDRQGRLSINGMTVNGQKCQRHILEDGDRIKLGCSIELIYKLEPVLVPKFQEYLNYQQACSIDGQDASYLSIASQDRSFLAISTITDEHLCLLNAQDLDEDLTMLANNSNPGEQPPSLQSFADLF